MDSMVRFDGEIYNLSSTGCSLRYVTEDVQIDEELWFHIDSVKPWKGNVRWIAGTNLGVEFEQPIFQSRLELIVHSHKTTQLYRKA